RTLAAASAACCCGNRHAFPAFRALSGVNPLVLVLPHATARCPSRQDVACGVYLVPFAAFAPSRSRHRAPVGCRAPQVLLPAGVFFSSPTVPAAPSAGRPRRPPL